MRESYELFACCGILFNHESEFRGEEFVTRKITKGLSEFFHGKRTQPIVLGNIDAKRDWGYAGDYVKAMIAMMNYKKAEEFVIATGETHSVREFAEIAFHSIGESLGWEIRKDKEIGITEKYGKVIITDKSMMREAEINILQGNAEKAYKKLHWKPTKKFETLVEDMVKKDIERTAKQFGVQVANKNYTSRLL
jgi:GDPmannose 4,6-dehydratase